MDFSSKTFFTKHAIWQIEERAISKREIMLALSRPDRVIRENGKLRFVKKVEKKNKVYLLVVITKKDGESIKVRTSFLTSKIKKYL